MDDLEQHIFSQFTDTLSLTLDPIDCIIVRLVQSILPPLSYCQYSVNLLFREFILKRGDVESCKEEPEKLLIYKVKGV